MHYLQPGKEGEMMPSCSSFIHKEEEVLGDRMMFAKHVEEVSQ